MALLRARAGAWGCAFETAPTARLDGERVSSTRARAALAAGDFALAERLLGRPYAICARVVEGDRRGRELGFPTANLDFPHNPALRGVFAVAARLRGGGESAGPWMPGAANIGTRPTVDGLRAAAGGPLARLRRRPVRPTSGNALFQTPARGEKIRFGRRAARADRSRRRNGSRNPAQRCASESRIGPESGAKPFSPVRNYMDENTPIIGRAANGTTAARRQSAMTAAATPPSKFMALLVLATLLVVPDGEAHAFLPGTWKYFENVDEMTGVKTVTASGWETGGAIIIQCHDVGGENGLFAFVSGHDFLGLSGRERDVMWRFDSQSVVKARGRVAASSGKMIILAGQNGKGFIRELATARKLLFRIWDYKGLQHTIKFDDLENASIHIRKVLDACH